MRTPVGLKHWGPVQAGIDVGQSVAVTPVAGCGQCKNCAGGWDNYCFNPQPSPGLGRDGGLAEYMSVPTSSLVPLQSLEPWQAAALTDAGLTSYHAINQAMPARDPAGSVVVIGVGGLGHMAVTILKAICGSQVIAVDRSAKARKLAEELGADVCLHSDDTTYEAINEITHGLGAKAVLDFVGISQTMQLAAAITAPMGKIVVVGLGGGVFEFREGAIRFGCSMQVTLGGSKAELMQVLALAESGRIQTRIERAPLDQIQAAYDRLERGEVVGRAVMIPQ